MAGRLSKAKSFSPFSKTVSEEAIRLEDDFTDVGIRFNAAQKTDNFLLDKAEGLGRAGFLSRDIFTNLDNKNLEAIARISRNIAKDFAGGLERNLDPEQLGRLLSSTQDFGRTAQKAISETVYGEVDELLKGGPVIRKIAQVEELNPATRVPGIVSKEVIEDQSKIVPTASLKGFVRDEILKSQPIQGVDIVGGLRRNFDRMLKMDNSINFKSAQRLRSFYTDLRRTANVTPKEDRVAAQMIQLIDGSMEQAATTLSPEGKRLWRRANNFFKKGKEVFENELMANLFVMNKKYPSEIGKAIFNHGTLKTKGTVETLRNMKKAIRRAHLLDPKNVNESEAVNGIKEGFYNGILNKHWKNNINFSNGGTWNFKGILNDLDDVNTKIVMNELYRPEEIKRIRDFALAGRRAEKIAPQAGSAFGLVQSSAIFGSIALIAVNPITAAVGLTTALGLPVLVGKMMTNPTSIRFLTQGFNELAKGTQRGIAAAINFAIRANKSLFSQGDVQEAFNLPPSIFPNQQNGGR